MTICEDGHDPIVYNDRSNMGRIIKCPACELLEQIKELESKIESMQDELDSQDET